MSGKTSIPRNLSNDINRRLIAGENKQHILNELKEQYYDQKSLAAMIASLPDPDKKAENTTLIYMLVAVTAMVGIFQFLYIVDLFLESTATVVVVAVRFIFGALLLLWTKYISMALGNFLTVHILHTLMLTLVFYTSFSTFEIIFLLLSGIIALVLRQRLFPHLGFAGAKKDATGNWILG